MTLYLGKRRVELRYIGRAHTAGDIVAYVPDANVVFSGDIVEYKSACYCGDAHFTDWPATLSRLDRVKADALVPGRGDALVGVDTVAEGIALTRDFLRDTYEPVKRGVARGASLKECFDEATAAMRPEVRQLAHLRALPALQHRPRLRRGAGHRHAAHLDRRARPRHVGGPAGVGHSRHPGPERSAEPGSRAQTVGVSGALALDILCRDMERCVTSRNLLLTHVAEGAAVKLPDRRIARTS